MVPAQLAVHDRASVPPFESMLPMDQLAKLPPVMPACKCAACGQEMTHVVDLRSIGRHEAARVFRCLRCNSVKSESM
jgi:hypothetical protein